VLVGGIFCDLQKTFDCVNHKILIDELEFCGIEGKLKTLIKSYFRGGHQRVVLDDKSNSGSTSKWEMIECGVPQGSILGPLLFLLCVNDLPKILNRDNYMVLYADDTSIIITDINQSNFKINLNRTFKKINTSFNTNLLTLNLKKTQYLKFGLMSGSKSPTRIICEQEGIATVTVTKFLGWCIIDTLSWKQQIEQIVNKMATACYALRNIKHMVSTEMLKLIYFAQVHSIISYGIIFWGSSTNVHKVYT
jgi:hypothetical protein